MLDNVLFYLVTCLPNDGRSYENVVREAILGGVGAVQLRAKELTSKELMRLACSLRKITSDNGIPFIINDRVDIALACQADGVHLGQDDVEIDYIRHLMADKIVGISTHNIEQAIKAQDMGADYIGVGPIFKTPTKPDLEPVGLDLINEVKANISIPFFCIGGINLNNVAQVIKTGGQRIAVSSAVCKAINIRDSAQKINAKLVTFKKESKN